MHRILRLAAIAGVFAMTVAVHAQAAAPAASAPRVRSTADIVRNAPASAWRRPDPNDVLAMTLPSGVVWIELAQRFAPLHAANIRTLVAQHYFDGLAVLRVQDNFVAQWGDPEADDDDASKGRSLGAAARKLAPEFSISDRGLKITRLKDRDVWAPVTGFVDGFPVAAEPKTHRAWGPGVGARGQVLNVAGGDRIHGARSDGVRS